MVTVNLTPGNHTITWTLTGYDTLESVINVTTTGAVSCISVTGGACNTSTPPGVITLSTVPGQVTGYLIASAGGTPSPTPPGTPAPSPEFLAWVAAKGGAAGILHNSPALLEMIGGFIGTQNIGFTPVSANLLTTIRYFLGV